MYTVRYLQAANIASPELHTDDPREFADALSYLPRGTVVSLVEDTVETVEQGDRRIPGSNTYTPCLVQHVVATRTVRQWRYTSRGALIDA